MEFERKDQGDIVVLALSGDLTMETYPLLKDTFSRLLENEPEVVILDMSRVEMVGSSAIGALVAFLREIDATGGRLGLAELSPMFLQVLELLKLVDFFKIFPDVPAAVAHFKSLD